MEIAILDAGYKSYSFERELFEKNGFTFKVYPTYDGEKKEKKNFASKADGILVRHTKIDEEFLSGLNNLKAIVRYGVGYDNIDVYACTKFGVKVANVQGYGNHSVSDHAMALLFMCSRALWNTKDQVTNKFAAPPVRDIFELHDKTLGIIGMGRIGGEFCKKASHLFKKTIVTDPYISKEKFNQLNVSPASLETLLQESDVISLHCNLTPETTHLLHTDSFSKMLKKPVVINTSRGEVIDEKALLKALDTGLIHSAGIDVYENEPTTIHQDQLINHERTVCTGHYAWYSDRAAQELQKRAALNLLNFLTGKAVEDCLNP